MQLVSDAIEKDGCVGVKLYPPMGFGALGNATLQGPGGAGFWARPWLPPWTGRTDLGQLLDAAMHKMLAWCQDHQVPVMAHTSASNGVSDDFEALAGAKYWAMALAQFPRLRVSFGHFGDTGLQPSGLPAAQAFADLMASHEGSSGQFAFADAGYFVEVMNSEPQLRETLRLLYEKTAPKGNAALANRFMYGTDWEMTLTEGHIDAYLSRFVELMRELESSPAIRSARIQDLAGKFFGNNAADWIGLRRGGRARVRLDAFYAANAVPTPDWMTKLDQSGA